MDQPPGTPAVRTSAARPSAWDDAPSRNILLSAIDKVDVCIAVMCGEELRYSLTNPAYRQIEPGVPMLGRRFRDVFPLAASSGSEECFLRVLRTGEPWHIQEYHAPTAADPGALWEGEAVLSQVEGEPASVIVFVRNVTARTRMRRELATSQQALARANRKLQDTIDSITDGVLVLDHAWRFTMVSERAGQIVGMQPQELVGGCLWDLFPLAHGTRFHDGYHAAMATGEPVHFEEYYPAPLDMWLECHCYPSPDELTVYFRDVTQRRRSEQRLRESTALLQAISDTSPDVIFAKDREGRLRFVNPATLALIGRDAAEALGRTDAEILADPEAARQVMANDQRIMDSGAPEELEEVVPLPDGTHRLWLSRKTPYRDEHGQVVGLLGISRDITERKRAEDELRKARDASERIVASITDGLAVLDRDWRYTYFSETGARMLGLRREDLVGGRLWDLFPHAGDTLFGREYRRAMESGEPSHFEEFYPEPLNRWIECHCYPSADGLSVYFRDVTERRQAADALAEGERRLRRVIEANPVGVVFGDTAGRLLDSNDAFLRMLRRDRSELQAGRLRWDELTPPEHREKDQRAVQEARNHGVASVYEKEYLLPDGGRVPVLVGCATSGRDDELVAFVVDITERKAAEEALRESDRRKSEFLAVLSHELRNSLAPISNSLHILDLAPAGSPQSQRATQVIRRQTSHLMRLVDDLLDMTRISSGKIALQLAAFDLRDIARKSVDDMQTLAGAAGVSLSLDPGGEPLPVHADAARLAQVLCNLVQNAVKFTPAGGSVRVSLGLAEGRAEVHVRDTGVGMDPASVEHMFEPFAQAEQPLARASGGLGLGLAIVKALVEMHGGSVRARSAGHGLGAEFTVRLPLSSALPVATDRQPRSRTAGMRLLIVEDNEDAGRTLAELLSLQGHTVAIASDAPAGLARAAAEPPDVILCDIGLPGMDGYAFARAVRAHPALRASRLVALSGYARPEDKLKARAAGFDDHMAKPADVRMLQALFAALPGDAADRAP